MAGTTPNQVSRALQHFGLARDRMRSALARRAGIGETDLDALEHLEADGPLTQKELGRRLSITSGAVTMLVDRLEASGWVRRGRHPTDRRSILLELTPRAGAESPEGLVAFHRRIQALAKSVPVEHRRAVIDFLDSSAAAAETAVDDLDPR